MQIRPENLIFPKYEGRDGVFVSVLAPHGKLEFPTGQKAQISNKPLYSTTTQRPNVFRETDGCQFDALRKRQIRVETLGKSRDRDAKLDGVTQRRD